MGLNEWEIIFSYLCVLQFELKVVQEEFRDAMTENAALEGEVSQLTYEVRSLYTVILKDSYTLTPNLNMKKWF